MLPILLSVVVISFSGVMMPGPMFAVTLAKSYRTPWAGVQIAIGHAVIEVPLILLIYFGFARFFESSPVQLALSVLGGAMIIWLGIAMFRARAEVVQGGKDLPYNAFIAGILTSGLNPFFLLWWATIGSMLIMKFLVFGAIGLIAFIIVHWLCDLVWLSFVSMMVYKTQSLWGGEGSGRDIHCLQPATRWIWTLVSNIRRPIGSLGCSYSASALCRPSVMSILRLQEETRHWSHSVLQGST